MEPTPLSTSAKLILTAGVAAFFYFAYTSSKMAEQESSARVAADRRRYARRAA